MGGCVWVWVWVWVWVCGCGCVCGCVGVGVWVGVCVFACLEIREVRDIRPYARFNSIKKILLTSKRIVSYLLSE